MEFVYLRNAKSMLLKFKVDLSCSFFIHNFSFICLFRLWRCSLSFFQLFLWL